MQARLAWAAIGPAQTLERVDAAFGGGVAHAAEVVRAEVAAGAVAVVA